MVNSENISPLKLIFDHSYFYRCLINGISFSLIGRPPSFDPAWFSQTMTLKRKKDCLTEDVYFCSNVFKNGLGNEVPVPKIQGKAIRVVRQEGVKLADLSKGSLLQFVR